MTSPPPSVLMARFTSGHRTTSSMPSIPRVGSSYGNLKREVRCGPLPPSVLMARFTSGHWTTSSMPSIPRVGSSYGNLKREPVKYIQVTSSPAIGSDGTVYVGSWVKKLYAINGKSGVKLWELETEVMWTPAPSLEQMARFTSGQRTTSSMPSRPRAKASPKARGHARPECPTHRPRRRFS